MRRERRPLANRVVICIRYEKIPGRIDGYKIGSIERCAGIGPIRTARGTRPPTNRGHHPIRSAEHQFSDSRIVIIRHINIAVGIDRYPAGTGELGTIIGPIGTAIVIRLARDRRHYPVGTHRRQLANRAAVLIDHEKVAARPHGNAARVLKLRFAIDSIGVTRTRRQPGDGGDHPIGTQQRDLPNVGVSKVRNNNLVGIDDRNAGRIPKAGVTIRAISRTIVVRQTGDGGDHPVRPDRHEFTDGRPPEICHINDAGSVHGDSGGRIEQSLTIGPIRTAGIPSGPGNRRHHPIRPGRSQLPDRRTVSVRHEDIPCIIDCSSRWISEAGSLIGSIREAVVARKARNGFPFINLPQDQRADLKCRSGSRTAEFAGSKTARSDSRRVGQDKHPGINRRIGIWQTPIRCIGNRDSCCGTRERHGDQIQIESPGRNDRRRGKGRNRQDREISDRNRAGRVAGGKSDRFHGGGICQLDPGDITGGVTVGITAVGGVGDPGVRSAAIQINQHGIGKHRPHGDRADRRNCGRCVHHGKNFRRDRARGVPGRESRRTHGRRTIKPESAGIIVR